MKEILTSVAPRASRPLDIEKVARRGRRLWWRRCVATSIVAAVPLGVTAVTISASDVFDRSSNGDMVGPAGGGQGTDPSGSIVFAAVQEGQRGALYQIDPRSNSSDRVPFDTTAFSGDIYRPAWSPDGSEIAFDADVLGDETGPAGLNSEIHILDRDGNHLRRLTRDTEPLIAPAWSPDGSKIIYGRADDAASEELWMMSSDGSEPQLLTARPTAGDASWSPDGRHIAFSQFIYDSSGSAPDAQEIFLVDTSDWSIDRLTHSGTTLSNPVWSPNGSKIAYFCGTRSRRHICAMDSDGSDQQAIHEAPAAEEIDGLAKSLAWSPDGAWLAFSSRSGTSSQLRVVNVIDGRVQDLGSRYELILGLDWR